MAAVAAGRWFGPRSLDRYGRVILVRVLTMICLVGVLLFVFGPHIILAFAGAVLWGVVSPWASGRNERRRGRARDCGTAGQRDPSIEYQLCSSEVQCGIRSAWEPPTLPLSLEQPAVDKPPSVTQCAS